MGAELDATLEDYQLLDQMYDDLQSRQSVCQDVLSVGASPVSQQLLPAAAVGDDALEGKRALDLCRLFLKRLPSLPTCLP